MAALTVALTIALLFIMAFMFSIIMLMFYNNLLIPVIFILHILYFVAVMMPVGLMVC